MKLSAKCACGATFDGEAEKGSLQTPDLNAAYLQWLRLHRKCALRLGKEGEE